MSMKITRRIIWIGLALSLLIPTTLVAAKELGKITITGPGISGVLIVDDPDELQTLIEGDIMDFTTAVPAPEEPGEGYILTMHLKMEQDIQPMLQLTYYPDQAGGPGLFNAVILMPESGKVDPAGKWYQVPGRTERTIMKMLASHGVYVAAASKSQPVTAPTAVFWGAGLLTLLLCAALLVYRVRPARQARTASVEE
jgi:hypothetical protein